MSRTHQKNPARSAIIPFALILIGSHAQLPAQNVGFVEHLAPLESSPDQITTGPDGALWFTGLSIGRITTAGVTSQYSYPSGGFSAGIVTGSDGALWFTETAGIIGRITTAGVVTEFPVPLESLQGIAAGSDGALWFTSPSAIGRITIAGQFTSYPIPTPNPLAQWITPGPDGALWFTELNVDQIGRITTSGVFTEFPVPPGTLPFGITAGPDGALWYTGETAKVGRITTAGVVTQYSVGTTGTDSQITTGSDGALWFSDTADSIGRITTAGVITTYPTPTRNNQQMFGITTGPDGAIWFTEIESENYAKIGQAILQTAVLSATPDTGVPGAEIMIRGGGFAANEKVRLFSDSTSANLIFTAFSNAAGAFVVSVPDPQEHYGPNSIVGVGQTSGALGIAPFTTKAHITVNPASAAPGTTITVSGVGFGAYFGVDIFGNPGTGKTLLGVAFPNSVGTFAGSGAFTFVLPANTPAGQYDVTATISKQNVVGAVIDVE